MNPVTYQFKKPKTLKNGQYRFSFDQELIAFTVLEVMSYTGKYTLDSILYAYNRMTVEELAQEVIVKLHRSVTDYMNKSYVRNAVRMVCIDEYRRNRDVCPRVAKTYDGESLEPLEIEATTDSFRDVERDLMMSSFSPKEKKVITQLRRGARNGETLRGLEIPKMSYYNLLNKMKGTHIDPEDHYLLA